MSKIILVFRYRAIVCFWCFHNGLFDFFRASAYFTTAGFSDLGLELLCFLFGLEDGRTTGGFVRFELRFLGTKEPVSSDFALNLSDKGSFDILQFRYRLKAEHVAL